MKVKYIGETFGVAGLKNEAIYNCSGVEFGMLRVITDYEAEGVLFSARNPRPLDGSGVGGRFEIVEDDENGTLRQAIYG